MKYLSLSIVLTHDGWPWLMLNIAALTLNQNIPGDNISFNKYPNVFSLLSAHKSYERNYF